MRETNGELIIGCRAIGRFLGVPFQTIHNWIRAGTLPAMQLPSGKWATTKSLINAHILAHYKEFQAQRSHLPMKPRTWTSKETYREKHAATAISKTERSSDTA